MENTFPEYCVAIRTLGKAGEKFVKMITSLKGQTRPPKAIYVYLAEGYSQPEQIADEVYITCPKGMMRQRAQRYGEIDTDYILFCDDDVCFQPDSVQKLFEALTQHDADCVAPKVFLQHKDSLKQIIMKALYTLALPSFFGKYAVRIRLSSRFSYALRPKSVMPTQSFAGPCFLAKKDAFLAVNLEDECWLDRFPYPLGDDQLLAYKLYVAGYSLLMHFTSGIIHQDAKTANVAKGDAYYHDTSLVRYVIWYRSVFQTRRSLLAKGLSVPAFYSSWLWTALMSALVCALRRRTSPFKASLKGLKDARRFVASDEFRRLPLWKSLCKS